MAKHRTPVPRAVAAELSHLNLHTCCWCREPRHPVEIHHINGEPTDHRLENLALLCRNCHGRVEQKGPLGRRISPETVIKTKAAWEVTCAAGGGDKPLESVHEEVLVRSGEYQEDWLYSLSEGETLVVGLDSDVAVTARIARQSDFRRWRNGEDADILDCRGTVFHCELSLEADQDNRYVCWIENEEDEDAIVEVDVAVWPAEDEEEDDEEDDDDEDEDDEDDDED